MTCDKCGANLTLDTDNGYAYCEHCGNKLYIDFSDTVLTEKEKTKQKAYDYKIEIEKNNSEIINDETINNSDIIFFCDTYIHFGVIMAFILFLLLICNVLYYL